MSVRNRRYYANHPGKKSEENRRYYRTKQKARRKDRRQESDDDMRFVAFDGEGSKGLYWLLACSATDQVLVSEEGLGTDQCLGYFAKLLVSNVIRPNDAIIGYGLSYDFENILRDIPDDIFEGLKKGERRRWGVWSLTYVQRKFLDVSFSANGRRWRYRLQDIMPYFQISFVKACESRSIVLPETVYKGKRQRSSFKFSDMDRIRQYNHDELVAMVALAETLRSEFRSAFDKLGLNVALGRLMWYGPGAQAGATLAAMDYDQLRMGRDADLIYEASSLILDRQIALSVAPSLFDILHGKQFYSRIRSIWEDPFCLAYYGGRIECAMQGRLPGPLYDYDLLSAYPYAMTRLPILKGKALQKIDRLDKRQRIGVYRISWEPVDGQSDPYGPFPYRAFNDNVFFPPYGTGWYMSPEIYSAVKVGRYKITVHSGYIIEHTEGYGTGRREGDSKLAKFVIRMGELRAEAKAADDPAHRGLKLIMNSLYGKTLQKEGSRKFCNAFVAAWITSVTRSLIYEAIGPAKVGEVVSVMTDGILSRVPLNVTLGDKLGSWELETWDHGYQYTPGVYILYPEEGSKRKPLKKNRGLLSFDEVVAQQAIDQGIPYETRNKLFVSRTYGKQSVKLRRKLYHFVSVKRTEEFALDSKRIMGLGIEVGPFLRYYPPKMPKDISDPSWPYIVLGKQQEDEDNVSGKDLSGMDEQSGDGRPDAIRVSA